MPAPPSTHPFIDTRPPIPPWMDDRLYALEAKIDLIIRLLREKH